MPILWVPYLARHTHPAHRCAQQSAMSRKQGDSTISALGRLTTPSHLRVHLGHGWSHLELECCGGDPSLLSIPCWRDASRATSSANGASLRLARGGWPRLAIMPLSDLPFISSGSVDLRGLAGTFGGRCSSCARSDCGTEHRAWTDYRTRARRNPRGPA